MAPVLSSPGQRGGQKKAIVAIARHLAIDLWRLDTGRTTAGKTGIETKSMNRAP